MKWICQICHIVRSVRESDLWSVRWEAVHGLPRPLRFESPICEADRPLTHSGRESDPRGYLTDFTAKRIASHGTDRPHRSDSQICEAVGGRARPLRQITWLCAWEADRTLKSVRPIGLSHTPGDAMRLAEDQTASPAVRERPIGLTDLRVRSASHAHRAMQSDPRGRLTDFTAKRIASPGVRSAPRTPTASQIWEAVCVRGRAPLIGSDRSHDKSERPWEAVRGRGRPWGSDWLRKIWDSLTQLPRSIWANQSPTASHGLPEIHWKCSNSLTFDSNSTSDRNLSDVLKMVIFVSWKRSRTFWNSDIISSSLERTAKISLILPLYYKLD